MATKASGESSDNWMPQYPLSEAEDALCLQLEQKFTAGSTTNINCMLPLMTVIQNIFKYSFIQTEDQSVPASGLQGLEQMEPKDRYAIYCLTWMIQGGMNCGTTLSDQDIMTHFHDVLRAYTWESKTILILAAFATMYGEFFFTLVEKQTNASPLANNLRALKQPRILRTPEILAPQFDILSTLATKMINLANVVVNFENILKEKNIPTSAETFKLKRVLHMVTCKFIKIMVTCSAYYTQLIEKDTKYVTTNTASDMEKYQYLNQDLDRVSTYVTQFLKLGAYKQVEDIFLAGPVEISDLISKLFPEPNSLIGKKDQNCLEEIKGKIVALLITDIHVRVGTLISIKKASEAKKGLAVIWIPLVDQVTDADESSFSKLAEQMPWFWCSPSKVPPAFSAYAMKEWKCEMRTTVVVFNSRAKLLNPNAFPLLQVFGPAPVPYSKDVAEVLFIQRLSMGALISGLLNINMENNKIVCLCGGDDVFLLTDFFESVQKINQRTKGCILPVYVGPNRNNQDQLPFQQIWKVFLMDGICLSKTEINTFWSSMEYVCQMRTEYYKNGDDETTQQLETLLSYNTEGLWSTLAYGGTMLFSELVGQKIIDAFDSLITARGIDEVWQYLCLNLKLQPQIEHPPTNNGGIN